MVRMNKNREIEKQWNTLVGVLAATFGVVVIVGNFVDKFIAIGMVCIIFSVGWVAGFVINTKHYRYFGLGRRRVESRKDGYRYWLPTIFMLGVGFLIGVGGVAAILYSFIRGTHVPT